MKNVLLAAAIALSAVSFSTPPSDAATVVITKNGVQVRDNDRRRRDYQRNQRRCRVETVRHYRNHRLVIEKVKVCR